MAEDSCVEQLGFFTAGNRLVIEVPVYFDVCNGLGFLHAVAATELCL
jgi:hypothetical protein